MTMYDKVQETLDELLDRGARLVDWQARTAAEIRGGLPNHTGLANELHLVFEDGDGKTTALVFSTAEGGNKTWVSTDAQEVDEDGSYPAGDRLRQRQAQAPALTYLQELAELGASSLLYNALERSPGRISQ